MNFRDGGNVLKLHCVDGSMTEFIFVKIIELYTLFGQVYDM